MVYFFIISLIHLLFADLFTPFYFPGNVTSNDSLFSLSDPEYNASFVPVFFDNVDQLFGNDTELQRNAEAACGSSNFQCLFDYVLTADSQAVKESQTSLQEFQTEEKILSKFIFYAKKYIFINKK